MISKQTILFLMLLTSLLGACGGDEEEELKKGPIFGEGKFSDAELDVLNKTLKLKASPFNYANLSLPAHYRGDEGEELDNTPGSNPITDMGATLGRVLFYDVNLSANNTISCASCHKQSAGFSDPVRFSKGLNGELTRRNSMTLINSRFYASGKFFWDERAGSLEEQSLMPIEDHIEMGMKLADLEPKLQQLDYYPILFEKAFGSQHVTADRIAKALSQYIRSIVSYNSKFDEGLIQAGNPEVSEEMPYLPNFTDKENLGLDIFMKGRNGATCQYCHMTPMSVMPEARNNGLAKQYADQGKAEATGNPAHNALFKAPSLRNIAQTGPYMHDGRFETLMDVVDHYSDNVQQHPNLHFRLSTVDDGPPGGTPMKLNLSQNEKEALVAFLHTLTDESITRDEKYSDPFK